MRIILYSIFILHQTTTAGWSLPLAWKLYSIFILHQTTTTDGTPVNDTRIVFYLYSTSNHNPFSISSSRIEIVFYLYSTSNHNFLKEIINMQSLYSIFILHQTTTQGQGDGTDRGLYSIFILHQTTTNLCFSCLSLYCILSLFYIKPQPTRIFNTNVRYCILSLFYIKPQLDARHLLKCWHCILSLFYIKPQL